ncbi:MAG: FIST N-terminal domain-containing protein [Rhodothermales bacterium]|nr:FIST N-terminal domain-containing protein [Rhodothermales bacterium]
MDLTTHLYTPEGGWSAPLPSDRDGPGTLVLAFGASTLFEAPDPLDALHACFPASHVIGCSTAGEIFGTTLVDGGLAVAVARFAHTRLETAFAEAPHAEASFDAGWTLAQQLDAPDLRGVLVLSDGHHVNGSALVRGLNAVLPPSVVVTGGLAGDQDRFERTWVLQHGRPRTGGVSAAGFYGDAIRIGHGSKGGWDIFGIERVVTRARGNVLYELDGQPALQLYKEYLGERADGLPATALLFPLALRADVASTESIVRTVLAVDEAQQSMTFAGDIPEGYRAQLMRANFERLIDGAYEAAQMTGAVPAPEQPVLSVAISCVGRRLVLGERAEEELEATLDVLPDQTHQVGFYSYGEISPYATGACDLHNQTMTLTTITEGDPCRIAS